MKQLKPRTTVTLALTMMLGLAGSAPAADAEPAPQPQSAEELIALSARAYQALPALTDTLALRVELPDGEAGRRIIRYALGPDRLSVEAEGLLGYVVMDKRIFVYRAGVVGRHVEAPIEGNLATTLQALGGTKFVGLLEPPQVALRAGGELDRVLDALRLTAYLEPLAIDTYQQLSDGRYQVGLAAANGSCVVRWDPDSLLIESFASRFQPAGAPQGYEVRLHGSFAPTPVSSSPPVSGFTPVGSTKVSGLNELADPAPGITAAPSSVLPPELLQQRLLDVDQLASQVQDRRVLLIGESHLVNEPLAFTEKLLERLEGRRFSLLLELPAQTQPLLDRYMRDGDEEALVTLYSQQYVLQTYRLVRWARQHRERVDSVLAIDEDQLRIRLCRALATDTRNQTMADAIFAEYRSHPETLVIAYCGCMHLMLAGRYRFDHPSREPAGSRLLRLGVSRSELASIMLAGQEDFPLGEDWSEPGVLPITGKLAQIPYPYLIDYPLYGVSRAGELFDYFVNLGPLTPVERMNQAGGE